MTNNPFHNFKTSPEIIQLAVMMYVRFSLSLRNVEDLLHERGIDICHETVRHWGDLFGNYFAHKICKRRSEGMKQSPQWQWHLDEVFVKIRGWLITFGERLIMRERCWSRSSRRLVTRLQH